MRTITPGFNLYALMHDPGSPADNPGKPLSTRLMLIPGRKAGNMTRFDFDYLVNTRVIPG